MVIQVQETQITPLKINKNRSTPQCIIVKLAGFTDKGKILKAAQDKRSLMYKGRYIRLATSPIHRDLVGQKVLACHIQSIK